VPSRVIRGDDLLDSERYMRLPAEAQVFYLHSLFAADDFGCLLATPTSLRRRLYIDPRSDAKIETPLRLVSEADLVRLYWFEGVRFMFLPRYRQALKKYMSRCPMPPPELFADDEHAAEKFRLFKDRFKKFAAKRSEATPSRSESSPEVEVEVDVEEKRREKEVEVEVPLTPLAGAARAVEDPVFKDLKVNSETPKGNGKPTSETYGETLDKKAALYGLQREPRESDNVLAMRICQAMAGKDEHVRRTR